MESLLSGWIRGLFCSPSGMARATQNRRTATPAARCKTRLKTLFTARFEPLENRLALAADGLLPAFDIGTPTVIDIWVNPSAGNDASSGASRDQSLRSLSAAWGRVPLGLALTTGVRINLVAGTYPESIVPNYWEARHGTLAAPVIIRAADGAGTARLPTVNVFDWAPPGSFPAPPRGRLPSSTTTAPSAHQRAGGGRSLRRWPASCSTSTPGPAS